MQLFERRSKYGKKNGREMKSGNISPDMMSEEVSGFVHHRYSWHSPVLNRFIENLDKRYSKQMLKA